MVNWQQIAQGEPNPFDVTYTSTSPYSASYNEFVITDGNQIDLPSPSANEAVMVRDFGQTVTITTPSGQIWNIGSQATYDSTEPILLVSDGTDWYLRGNEDALS